MNLIIQLLVGFIAFQHLLFFYVESFAWETIGKKLFKGLLTVPDFKITSKLAANQGVYNAFLSAGLIWTFFIQDVLWVDNIRFFFLACIIIAGSFGAYSISKRIFIVQAIPSILTVILLIIDKQF